MKPIKGKHGITLIALIATVVTMLILAGVSISVLTGDNGLFGRVTMSNKIYTKQTIIEAIDSAEIQLRTEKMLDEIDGNEHIDIDGLINKAKEISTINDKDYIISVNTVEQTANIIEPKTCVVVDVIIDNKNNVIIEGSIVDDIATVIKPTIEYTLEPAEGTYAEEITITIIVKEEKNGIAKIQFPDNTEKPYSNIKTVTADYKVTQNGTYKFTAVSANGKTTSVYIEVKNSMQAGNIIMTVTNPEPTKDSANLVITYDPNVKVGGQALTNADRFQYSIGENKWQTAMESQTVKLTENSKVYARYFDGINGYKTTSIIIMNVDRVGPTITSATASTEWGATNSITITAKDSGSAGCAAGNIGIVGYGINQSDTTEPTYTTYNGAASLSTTINNITANGTYYVWVKDKAGNTANKAVTVSKVDTADPTTATIASNNITTTTATLTATGADGESGISKYEFYVDGTLYNTVTTSEVSANITLTFAGSSHSCMVKVYDMAENYKDSNTITVSKHVHTDACYNWTTKTGYIRWTDGPGSMTGDYTVKCDLCGRNCGTDWEGTSIGNKHCTQNIRGSLICGK